MDTAITLNVLLEVAGIVASIWGFYKIVTEIVKAITARYEREHKWDEQATKWNEYDMKIENVEKKIDDTHSKTEQHIEDLRADMEAKMQEINAEQCLLTYAVLAILDGLKQQGCNGKVTEAREMLDKHLNKKAHDQN